MDILFWVVVIVAAALIALVIVSRSAARSRVDPTQVTIDPAVATEVRRLYATNDKVKAVKALRAATGLGLADAVRIADKLAATGKPKAGASGSARPSAPSAGPDRTGAAGLIGRAEESQIRALLAEDRRIDAIKMARRLSGMSLDEAKEYVNSL